MPRKVAFAPKPALEKLPLAVRKDIRDNYEAKKEDWEAQATELLGTEFKFNFKPLEVWAYADDSTSSAGYLFAGYADGFIYGLKYFLDSYEDEGKAYFNKAVTQSEVTLEVNPLGEDAPTITADIKDGVFRILFKVGRLGYNQSSLDHRNFANAIDAVTEETFSLKAKSSILKSWEDNVDDLTKAIGEILNMPDVVLDPNFEENYAALKAAKKDNDWHESFGTAVYEYFERGLKYNLEYSGFKDDDMLQEGFAEAITSKTIKLRIVKDMTKSGRNEAVIEGDVLYLQTKPDYWYSNVSDMGDNIIKLL